MDWLQALILGLVQGLTEFLPVSSSGHIEMGKALFNINAEGSIIFTVVVHGATVLSTLVVFWKDIVGIIKGLFQFKWNVETQYAALLLFSTIPVIIIGLLFEDQISAMFEGNILLVGLMLVFTASLLAFTYYYKPKARSLNFPRVFIIGIAQAIAVLPGISRSGSTIATALLMGVDKEKATRFSFLMVLIPIIGVNLLEIVRGDFTGSSNVAISSLVIGFIAAFVSGLLACTWMIKIVKKGKLIYFAAYCLVVGLIAMIFGLL